MIKNEKIYAYRKITDEIQKILELINSAGLELHSADIYIDSTRDFITYKKLKQHLLEEHGIVCLKSPYKMGQNTEAILSVLKWFLDNNVELVIEEFNGTHCFDTQHLNHFAILSV